MRLFHHLTDTCQRDISNLLPTNQFDRQIGGGITLHNFLEIAEQGDADTQYNLGHMYNNNNYTEAAKWFRKAAEQGDVDAQNELGFMYLGAAAFP